MRGCRRLLPLAMLLPLTLTGCATTMGIAGTDTPRHSSEGNQLVVCQAWTPVYWRDSWPDDAILQAKQNNAARLAWGCPR